MTKYLDSAPFMVMPPAKEFKGDGKPMYADRFPELVDEPRRRKQLTHEEAARREHYCPKCRLIHYDNPPRLYLCQQCGAAGYDCCFDKRGPICNDCDEESSRA